MTYDVVCDGSNVCVLTTDVRCANRPNSSALLYSYSCEDKFVQERGVARLWEVARFDFLLPHD